MIVLRSQKARYLFAALIGLAYGLGVRLLFWINEHRAIPVIRHFLDGNLFVMTVGFLVGVPILVGWLAEASCPHDGNTHWKRWIFFSWLPILVTDTVLLLCLIEGSICILMSIPITFFCGSLGGMAAGLVYRRRKLHPTTLGCFALLPLILSAIEVQYNPPLQLRTVQTSIHIHAPATAVWRNIERVPAIAPSELKPTWTHAIGFPRPIEATLSHEGLGGVRNASFEGNLLFIETIHTWEPLQRIGFSIAADTTHIPPTTLDEHVTIGGRYFDVLDGEYRLEPLPSGDILLHLSSSERLSTDFNAYAGLWSDLVMRSLQNSILQVIKTRCETQSHTLSLQAAPPKP